MAAQGLAKKDLEPPAGQRAINQVLSTPELMSQTCPHRHLPSPLPAQSQQFFFFLPSNVSSPSEINSSSEHMLRMLTSISVTARSRDREMREGWCARAFGTRRDGEDEPDKGTISRSFFPLEVGSQSHFLSCSLLVPRSSTQSRRHPLHLLPRRWLWSKRSTDEAAVGSGVPASLPPHPKPAQLRATWLREPQGCGEFNPRLPQSQKSLGWGL